MKGLEEEINSETRSGKRNFFTHDRIKILIKWAANDYKSESEEAKEKAYTNKGREAQRLASDRGGGKSGR